MTCTPDPCEAFGSRNAFRPWDSCVRLLSVIDVDTDTTARALGCATRTARDVLARVAAHTGRAGLSASGGRPSRTVPVADLAEWLGLDPADVIDAASLTA